MEAISTETLKKFPLFADIEEESLNSVLSKLEKKAYTKDSVVLSTDQPNDAVYFVLDGKLRVVLDDEKKTVITRLGFGECVGELSVLDEKPPSAFVIADSDTELLSLDRDGIWHLIDASHSVARNLLYILSSRLRSDKRALRESISLQVLHKNAARKDSLTGLYNRLWLDETLGEFVEHSHHRNTPLAMLLFDVDCFKQYNDLLGHQAGDNALKIMADTLREHTGINSYVARYGGEEFIMLIPGLNSAFLGQTAQRICDSLRAKPIVNTEGQPLPGITTSIGASMLEPGQSGKDLIKIADQALYLAKQQGRDRVVVLSVKYGSTPYPLM